MTARSPGFGDNRRAEQLLLPFDLAHHEIAGLEPPIDVPLGRLVAAVQEQRGLGLAPVDRKLVLLGEVADAAEVEHHDRLQRMLPRRAERAVIDHLHQREKTQPSPGRTGSPCAWGIFASAMQCRRRGSARRSARSDAAGRRRRTAQAPALARAREGARRARRQRKRSPPRAASWSRTAHRAR